MAVLSTDLIMLSRGGTLHKATVAELNSVSHGTSITLEVIAAASVPTPPAGSVVMFFNSSNLNRLSQKDSTGAVIDLASTGGGAATVDYVRRTIATPSLATLTPLGLSNTVSAGTAAAVALAATNNYTTQPKMAYRVTTAATTAVARYQSVAVYMCGTRDITVRIRAGIDTGGNNASKQFFIGLGNATAPNASATTNPITGASYPNTIGIGLDIASTQFAVFSRNGTATTQTSTGIADPTNNGTIFFDVVINLKEDRTATVNWIEKVSGVSGSATYTAAQTPALNTLLSPGAWITSGGVSSVIGLGFGGIEGTE